MKNSWVRRLSGTGMVPWTKWGPEYRQLWTRLWTYWFHKMQGISWAAEELLASQELCCVALVISCWLICEIAQLQVWDIDMLRQTKIGVGNCIHVCSCPVLLLHDRWRKGGQWRKCLYDSPHFGCLPELQHLLGLHLSLIFRIKRECQIANASSISLSARCCCCCSSIPVKNGKQAAEGVTNRHSLLGVGLFKVGFVAHCECGTF